MPEGDTGAREGVTTWGWRQGKPLCRGLGVLEGRGNNLGAPEPCHGEQEEAAWPERRMRRAVCRCCPGSFHINRTLFASEHFPLARAAAAGGYFLPFTLSPHRPGLPEPGCFLSSAPGAFHAARK